MSSGLQAEPHSLWCKAPPLHSCLQSNKNSPPPHPPPFRCCKASTSTAPCLAPSSTTRGPSQPSSCGRDSQRCGRAISSPKPISSRSPTRTATPLPSPLPNPELPRPVFATVRKRFRRWACVSGPHHLTRTNLRAQHTLLSPPNWPFCCGHAWPLSHDTGALQLRNDTRQLIARSTGTPPPLSLLL